MKHLKLFNDAASYEAYMEGDGVILPNVSYIKDGEVYYNPEPVISYVAVDLGLPSGTLWADRNIGAESPEDSGLYFQWGDTVGYTLEQVANGEKVFDWDTYFDTTDGGSTFNKYARTNGKLRVLEASDDAASVNMGSDWRMPTFDELYELTNNNNTTITFIDLQGNEFSKSEVRDGAIAKNNFKGFRFTGKNGNSIIIPASGYCTNSKYDSVNDGCFLWSSTLSTSGDTSCLTEFITNIGAAMSNVPRFRGHSVRGVK